MIFFENLNPKFIEHRGRPNQNIVLKNFSSKDIFYQDTKDWHLLSSLTRTEQEQPATPSYTDHSTNFIAHIQHGAE
jgi:hypothetical protein